MESQIIDLAYKGKGPTHVTCNLQPFPFRSYGASGAIINGTPMICGGTKKHLSSDACYIYEKGEWIEDKVASLSTPRVHSGSVVLDKKLIMVGGDEGRYYLDTIEVVSPEAKSTILDVDLPFGIKGACVVAWDENTLFVIGGYSEHFLTKTYFINIRDETIEEGPALSTGRASHGCQEVIVQNKPYIIVAGGNGQGGPLKSTEMLEKWLEIDQDAKAKGWISGKDIPVDNVIEGLQMVASPKKDFVYSIGGYGAKNKVFKFSCSDGKLQNCKWEFESRLSVPRYESVAMSLPDDDLANKLCQ